MVLSIWVFIDMLTDIHIRNSQHIEGNIKKTLLAEGVGTSAWCDRRRVWFVMKYCGGKCSLFLSPIVVLCHYYYWHQSLVPCL